MDIASPFSFPLNASNVLQSNHQCNLLTMGVVELTFLSKVKDA
jgi:hypothetical protein